MVQTHHRPRATRKWKMTFWDIFRNAQMLMFLHFIFGSVECFFPSFFPLFFGVKNVRIMYVHVFNCHTYIYTVTTTTTATTSTTAAAIRLSFCKFLAQFFVHSVFQRNAVRSSYVACRWINFVFGVSMRIRIYTIWWEWEEDGLNGCGWMDGGV